MLWPLRPLVFVVVAVALTGCPDVSVPPGARLTCSRDSDCPANWSCVSSVGRCVDLTDPDRDRTPPRLSDARVDVDVAGPRTPIVWTFTVDEDLGALPTVTVGGTRAALAIAPDRSSRSAAFAYVVVGDEGLTTLIASAHLVDLQGNSVDVTLPAVPLDLVGPAGTIDVQLLGGRTAVRDGDLVVVTGTLDADASVQRVVARVGDNEVGTTSEPLEDGELARFSFSDALVDGAQVSVSLVVADAFENLSVLDAASTVTVDLTPPPAPGFSLPAAAGNVDVAVAFLLEPGASICVKAVDAGQPSTCADSEFGVAPTTVHLPAGNGIKQVRAIARDGAFNRSDLGEHEMVLIDSGHVRASVTMTPPSGQTRVKGGDVAVLAMSSNTGSTFVRARLLDATDAVIDGALDLDVVDAGIHANDHLFNATFVVPEALPPSTSLRVEAIFGFAGLESAPTASRSNTVVVDDVAPTLDVTIEPQLPSTAAHLDVALVPDNDGDLANDDVIVALSVSGDVQDPGPRLIASTGGGLDILLLDTVLDDGGAPTDVRHIVVDVLDPAGNVGTATVTTSVLP